MRLNGIEDYVGVRCQFVDMPIQVIDLSIGNPRFLVYSRHTEDILTNHTLQVIRPSIDSLYFFQELHVHVGQIGHVGLQKNYFSLLLLMYMYST